VARFKAKRVAADDVACPDVPLVNLEGGGDDGAPNGEQNSRREVRVNLPRRITTRARGEKQNIEK
jgi:hypothetical protein